MDKEQAPTPEAAASAPAPAAAPAPAPAAAPAAAAAAPAPKNNKGKIIAIVCSCVGVAIAAAVAIILIVLNGGDKLYCENGGKSVTISFNDKDITGLAHVGEGFNFELKDVQAQDNTEAHLQAVKNVRVQSNTGK